MPARIIARLDVKGENLIKGIHLEGLRVIGSPSDYALRYYAAGVDEIILMDAVASLYGRNNLMSLISSTADKVFVPITAGGGVRSVSDVKSLLESGADKVAVNTAALARPRLLTEIAEEYGSQCLVLSVEARRTTSGWEAMTDNGRENTGKDVVSWIREAIALGAGEILLTSVDKEGTREGFDLELLESASKVSSVPLIASGGFGQLSDGPAALRPGRADAIAIADALHYERLGFDEIRAAVEIGVSQ